MVLYKSFFYKKYTLDQSKAIDHFSFKGNLKNAIVFLIPLLYSIIIISCFLKSICGGPLESYAILDTYTAFFDQFDKNWLSANSFSEKLKFFVSKSNWPHPKIIVRISTILSYYGLGHVDIKLITLISNLGMLGTCLAIYRLYFRNKLIYLLPILLLLLQVFEINFWTVAIIAHGFAYLLIILFFYFLINKKYTISIILLFIIFFRSGAGFLIVCPLFLVLLLLKYKDEINMKHFLIYGISSSIFFSIFYLVTLEGTFSGSRTSSLMDDNVAVNFITKISSIFVYSLQVLGTCFTSRYYLVTQSTLIDFVMGAIGVFFLFYFLSKYKSLQIKYYPLIGAAIYFGLLCLLAGFMNDDATVFFEITIARYEHFSIFFLISIYALTACHFYESKLFQFFFILLLVFSSICFFDNYIGGEDKILKLNKSRTKSLYNNLVGDYYSKPYTMPLLSRRISVNKIMTRSMNIGLLEKFDFNAITSSVVDNKLTSTTNTIDSTSIVNYYKFSQNGLIKIVGSANFKLDKLVIIADENGDKKIYTPSGIKKIGSKYFFDCILTNHKNPIFSFAQLTNDKLSFQKVVSNYSFKVNLLKNNLLTPFEKKHHNKVSNIEGRFYKAIENLPSKKLRKLNSTKGQELKKYLKSNAKLKDIKFLK